MFATAGDLEQFTGGEFDKADPAVTAALEAATQAIRNYCGWHIAPLQEVHWVRLFRARELLWLPAMEIKSIVEATIDGEDVAVAFDPYTGETNARGKHVDIKFMAGFNPVPADLKQLTLELAVGSLVSPMGVAREQAGAVSVSYSRVSGSFLADDYNRLDVYKLGRLP